MSRIVLDEATLARLGELTGSVAVCDSRGKVVGYFRPKLDPEKDAPLEPQVSEEELRRREQSDRWYTTAEVRERLRHLEEG